MDMDTYLNKICVKFDQNGFKLQNDEIHPFVVIVATKKQFDPALFAIQMNFFAIMGVSTDITNN